MNPEELSRFFEQKRKEFEDYRRNKWPRMAKEELVWEFIPKITKNIV